MTVQDAQNITRNNALRERVESYRENHPPTPDEQHALRQINTLRQRAKSERRAKALQQAMDLASREDV